MLDHALTSLLAINGRSMPSFFIRNCSVLRLMPSRTAAPRGPDKDRFELGGEAALAAGPVGRNAGAATDALMHAAILSYSRRIWRSQPAPRP